MKISLNWLKDYIDLRGINTDEIVHNLTMSGLEVEDVIDQTKVYKDFVVGLVDEIEKHPNADKLSICKVFDGKENLQVICGARNVEKGQKVVFAPIGAIIPKGEVKLKKVKIRGVESYGMICAEDELELSDDHSGIMVLNEDLKAGQPITEALELNDVILEIGITPNRPDALSHIGVARDLAAIYERKLKIPSIKVNEGNTDINILASIEILDKINCPRYSSRVVTDIKISDSPDWLKKKIRSIGLRPINNIVDITNFVMYECGQPLHAFDLDRLGGRKIIIKSTKSQSKFTTLDSKERELPKDTLMICDAEKDVAVAGIMGGENSEIYYDTKNVLIESAYFNPSSIRKTSKALQLSTDASYRFERGTNPNNTLYAAERTAQLISEIAGGKIAKGVIDIFPKKIKKCEIDLRLQRIKKLLGYEVSKDKTIKILTNLGFEMAKTDGDVLHVIVPSFRPDVEREVDVIEEIARISGYDNIPIIPRLSISLERKVDETIFVENLKKNARALGLYEMINNPLQPKRLANLTGKAIKLANPLSLDMKYLRTSLIPGALSVIARNLNKGEKNLALFEIGNVFNLSDEKNSIQSFDDFDESEKLLIIISGYISEREWYSTERSFDFYDLRGIVDSLLEKISLDNVFSDTYNRSGNALYDYYFTKTYKDCEAGIGGKIRGTVLKQFDISQDVYCFECSINDLKGVKLTEKRYSEMLKYPKVIRDFAFIFNKETEFITVQKYIMNKSSNLLKDVNVFDIFESEELGNNKKSMAFQLIYFDENRTLTEDEVEKDFENLIKLVTKEFKASLRG